jgi:hypothetical protein
MCNFQKEKRHLSIKPYLNEYTVSLSIYLVGRNKLFIERKFQDKRSLTY